MREPEHNDRVLCAVIVQALARAGLEIKKGETFNSDVAPTLALAMAMRDVRNAQQGV